MEPMYDCKQLHKASRDGIFIEVLDISKWNPEDPVGVEIQRLEGKCWYISYRWTKTHGWHSKPATVGCPYTGCEVDFPEASLTLIWFKQFQQLMSLQSFLDAAVG